MDDGLRWRGGSIVPRTYYLGDKVKTVQGVSGSARPCTFPTCGGEMVAFLYVYNSGRARLMFKCNRCKCEHDYGTTTAVTREPANQEEALA